MQLATDIQGVVERSPVEFVTNSIKMQERVSHYKPSLQTTKKAIEGIETERPRRCPAFFTTAQRRFGFGQQIYRSLLYIPLFAEQ